MPADSARTTIVAAMIQAPQRRTVAGEIAVREGLALPALHRLSPSLGSSTCLLSADNTVSMGDQQLNGRRRRHV